jgi:ankyrin repeat protein
MADDSPFGLRSGPQAAKGVAVPSFSLPDNASLEQLRKQAKDLRDLAGAGVPGALGLVAANHPQGAHAVTLTGAQMVVARHYGFASWARLKQHLEMIERYRRAPDEVADPDRPAGAAASAGSSGPAGSDALADEFLALACLRFGGDDGPDRWERAARLLAGHPELTRASVHVAAAAADEPAVRAHLAADPALAAADGGPYGWPPLLYLAFSRHDPQVSEASLLGTARALLDHGADPNSGYLWHGLYPPFTAVTGALGGGETGQPQRRHGFALAALLLAAGADANDGQALYNLQFGDDDRHLVLLFEHGLGRGDGGPWAARFGHTAESPGEMLRGQLWWAIVHDMRDRARLLVGHGTDFLTPYAAPNGRPLTLRTSHGRTPAEVAALSGSPELARWLVAQGAAEPALTGPDALIAAVLAGDSDAVGSGGLREHVAAAREQRPGLIVWAAARGRAGAVEMLAGLGFDVNARGRSDVPAEQEWETALHHAAGEGDLDMARLLLRLGADPGITDTRFGATPLGWARHFGRPAMIALLEPLTS